MNARIAGVALLAVALVFGLSPLVRGTQEIPTAQHHLLHAILLAISASAGVLCAGNRVREGRFAIGWLLAAVIAPVIAMLLMWPSEYSYFDAHSLGHAVEHVAIVLCGFLTGYAGQRFAAGIGWAAALSVVAMALLDVWGYGVAPAPAPAATTALSNRSTGSGVAHGAAIFKQNCAACHGANGEGGAGPSLRNEASRKDLKAAELWIEHPAPPMPQLYPSTLSAADVADVAAYIETIK